MTSTRFPLGLLWACWPSARRLPRSRCEPQFRRRTRHQSESPGGLAAGRRDPIHRVRLSALGPGTRAVSDGLGAGRARQAKSCSDRTGHRAVSRSARACCRLLPNYPREQTVRYKLQAGRRGPLAREQPPERKQAGEFLEIANERHGGTRPGSAGESTARAGAAATVPAPLLGFKHQGQAWIGGSHFVTARQIAAYQFRLIEDGNGKRHV